ncbi:MAG: carboxylesterase/lipase family protein [Syntrophaceae bacterium]|nr:carboxylesterase/lipase family protein [Syntrophaceae bacterium]MBN1474048.1 carboxylesterase/lipase family protein [Syntrophaceae bacterium]
MRKNYFLGFRKIALFALAAMMLLFASCATKPATAPEASARAPEPVFIERQTAEGIVVGEINKENNTQSWKGVPYAKPPVGELRWKEPQAPDKRTAPLKTTAFSNVCPQYVDHDRNPNTPWIIQGNEDCLYLNIWRPDTEEKNLPVFFWIHGGGNSIQWPLLSNTDSSVLAGKKNMVVVTVNYRLGPMGFFNHPALKSGSPEDKKSDSGNFALLDIIQALNWVQANIGYFGGNAQNITVVGESAGAFNIISLIASPLTEGLFHRAVSQSGGVRVSTPEKGAMHAEEILARLLVKSGNVPDEKAASAIISQMSLPEIASYLKSKSAEEFLETYPEGPTVGMIRIPNTFLDGTVLPLDIYKAFKSGKYNKVPVILGTNKEEAKLFLRLDKTFSPWTRDGSLFSDPAKGELYTLAAKYQSDGWKVMGVDNIARIFKTNEGQPDVFAYQFLWGAGGLKDSVIRAPFGLLLGACHAMEIDFVFGTEKTSLGPYAFIPKNRAGRVALSEAMMDYWAHFARTGNPNREGSGLPLWQPWSNAKGAPKTILLDADLENTKIEMSNQELTNVDIEKALRAEARRKEIKPFWDNSLFRTDAKH